MNSFGIDICEVCGSQSADHAGWFSVAGSGSKMEVLPWTDETGRRGDCLHACCGEHMQKLILSTATRDVAGTALLTATKQANWDPKALIPKSSAGTPESLDETLVNLLSAVDSVLHIQGEDDDDGVGFDA